MSALTDFSFGRNYHCEILDELPGAEGLQRHFFPGDLSAGQDGLLVRVTPDGGEPWVGTFAFGKLGSAGVSRVLSLPDSEKLCVVSRGEGYVMTATAPHRWESIPLLPITDVRAVTAAGVVLFANFTDLLAYGAGGVRWRTQRLAWDDLRIVEVTATSVLGEYWDYGKEATQRFEVDLATGAQRGGVEG